MATLTLGKPIYHKVKRKRKKSKVIRLGKPRVIKLKKKKTGISAYREKKTIGGKAVKALTSLKTTAVLGTILAGLISAPVVAGRVVAMGGARVVGKTAGIGALRAVPKVGKALIPKTAKGKVALVGAGYLATQSPKFAKAVITSPFKAKKALDVTADIIEGDKPLTSENVIDVAKTAGIIGGVGAVAVGAGVVAKKVLEKREKTPSLPVQTMQAQVLPAQAMPAQAGQVITPTLPITPETVSLDEITEKPASKKPIEPRRQTIKQRVDVNVIGSYSSKRISRRYLNPIIYN